MLIIAEKYVANQDPAFRARVLVRYWPFRRR
jgi:hypothetical protein